MAEYSFQQDLFSQLRIVSCKYFDIPMKTILLENQLVLVHILRNIKTGGVMNSSQFQVFLGLHNILEKKNSSVQSRTVTKIDVHPKFDPIELLNDVAILTLTDPAEITAFVDIVCLAKQPVKARTVCYATGFGLKDLKTSKKPEIC